MYIITYKNKVATLERLYKVAETYPHYSTETNVYLATPYKWATVALYIFYFGGTWKQRPKGVEASKRS